MSSERIYGPFFPERIATFRQCSDAVRSTNVDLLSVSESSADVVRSLIQNVLAAVDRGSDADLEAAQKLLDDAVLQSEDNRKANESAAPQPPSIVS